MKSNILIVDDEADILDLLVEMIKDDDRYVIHTAGSGQEAIEIVRDKEITLILSDIQMPVMNGLEMYQNMKDTLSEKVYKMEVIFISSFADAKITRKIIALGAYDIIDKPFEEVRIVHRVENAILKAKERRMETKIINKIINSLNIKVTNDYKSMSPTERIERLGKIFSILEMKLLTIQANQKLINK